MGDTTTVTVHDNHGEINIGRKKRRVRPSGIRMAGRFSERNRTRRVRALLKAALYAVPPWREVRTGVLSELLDVQCYHLRDPLQELEDEGVVVSTSWNSAAPEMSADTVMRFWRLRQAEDKDPKVVARALEHVCPRCDAAPGQSCRQRHVMPYGDRGDMEPHGDRLRLGRGR